MCRFYSTMYHHLLPAVSVDQCRPHIFHHKFQHQSLQAEKHCTVNVLFETVLNPFLPNFCFSCSCVFRYLVEVQTV